MESAAIGDCRLELAQGDITGQEVDAVVNAANSRLAPGGGVAGAIHRAAGPELWEECQTMQGCRTGQATITAGYRLPARYVIHTVGPVYSGAPEDAERLASCYRESLRLARRHELKSVAFPAISTGAFGYPVEEAAEAALRTVIRELQRHSAPSLVRFVLFDRSSLAIHRQVLADLAAELLPDQP